VDDETLISYSSSSSKSTKSISISYSTTVHDTSIQISMSCDDSFTDKMTEWGAAIVKEGDSVVTLDDKSYISASKNSSTNEYVATLTELKSNTAYVLRIRAKYNNEYYIYQDTKSISSLKGPSKEDMENPDIKK
jgi:hypothetical protein